MRWLISIGLFLSWAVSLGAAQHWVDLKWQPSTTLGVTYAIYRTQTPGTNYVRRNAGLRVTQWRDPNVKAGKTYYYVVKAQKNKVLSKPSNEAKATIPR